MLPVLSGRLELQPPNQPVSFNGAPIYDAKRCAHLFNCQFTPHPMYARSRTSRRVYRKLRSLTTTVDDPGTTPGEVEAAIKSVKSSVALGPDQIASIHLKHLDRGGIEYLTGVLNLSFKSFQIPAIWKVGRVVPILKPGKSADESKSYRPIALLSPVAKIAEVIKNGELQRLLPFAAHQHGFRAGHSTSTALSCIVHNISTGMNAPSPHDRTLLAALDLSSAFDTVSHEVLLNDILLSPLPNNTKRWLYAYLRGRSTYVEFRGQRSKYRRVKQGVPQGGVLSPALFNYYLSTLPTPPDDIQVVSYADDITVMAQGKKPGPVCKHLSTYLDKIADWFQERNLILSPAKSTVTLFTTWTKQMNRTWKVTMGGHTLPTNPRPKILGVIFDKQLSFAPHARSTSEKVSQRNNILKKLTGATWGCCKEVLLQTYKAIGRSVLNYGAPIWSPLLSNTQWQGLQARQNQALRTSTGCLLMTSIPHLHHEAEMMEVRPHNELLSVQFYLGAHLPERPDHHTTNRPPPKQRTIKETLWGKYRDDVEHLVFDGLNPVTYREALRSLHLTAVEEAISQYTPPLWPNNGHPDISERRGSYPEKQGPP